MGLVAKTAEFFLLSLGLGLGGFTALVNTQDTGVGFLRLNNAVCMGALVLALTVHFLSDYSFDIQTILYVATLMVFLSIHFLHKDEKAPMMWTLYGLHNAFILSLLVLFFNQSLLSFGIFLTSSLFLGIITFAMLLGHWYLVTPKLSERPLKVAMIVLWVLLGIKLIITSFSMAHSYEFFTAGTSLGAGLAFNWLMLLMRIGWGYLVIGVMSYFTWKLIEQRSLQSATGILYVMTFFVFIGELISTYIFYNYGLYL